jgi:hypothetical protein
MMFSALKRYLRKTAPESQKSDRELILIGQAALRLRNSINPKINDLREAELKVFSQWGEDGILDYICHKLSIHKPRMLEFGVGDFSECNSRFLVENRNASVVLVDSHPGLLPFVHGQDCYWKSTVIPVNDWITRSNAQALLEKARENLEGIDIFSIDLDGNDYWILDAMNLGNIRVVVTEYNPVYGPTVSMSVPPKDDFNRNQEHSSNLYYGASLRAFIKLMSAKGFRFAGTNNAGSNAFFVGISDFDFLEIEAPNDQDLSTYCDWRVRESRDGLGNLSLMTGSSRWEAIKEMPYTHID